MGSGGALTLHASTVAIDGRAVMLTGASGAGKSDLALRLIDRGALLVSDDYTVVRREADALIAAPPATIRGRIEVRGLGIAELLAAGDTPVALVVRLGAAAERMPEREWCEIAGVRLRSLALDPFTASAPIKVEIALRQELP
ncbi:HPr kinase [Sphingomonas metalli]|uniref:HPr kinase n=1 Tax=Sphingomonas metalli TaxID=1779358 RepID=A0A916WVK4_9SPHN|nr:HPr kinase/phosphatase C-terminal domain-containing protein [Sphingomonas metalli]GGB33477.1 HPr kinase [Sphingomonas metalli]